MCNNNYCTIYVDDILDFPSQWTKYYVWLKYFQWNTGLSHYDNEPTEGQRTKLGENGLFELISRTETIWIQWVINFLTRVGYKYLGVDPSPICGTLIPPPLWLLIGVVALWIGHSPVLESYGISRRMAPKENTQKVGALSAQVSGQLTSNHIAASQNGV
jgi:hypothetical protein